MVNFYVYYNTHTHTHTHIYIYIYKYKITVNPKRYTGIDRYRNISFHLSNWYSLRYEIDSLDFKFKTKTKNQLGKTADSKILTPA